MQDSPAKPFQCTLAGSANEKQGDATDHNDPSGCARSNPTSNYSRISNQGS